MSESTYVGPFYTHFSGHLGVFRGYRCRDSAE